MECGKHKKSTTKKTLGIYNQEVSSGVNPRSLITKGKCCRIRK
jgi:hypothetical protein